MCFIMDPPSKFWVADPPILILTGLFSYMCDVHSLGVDSRWKVVDRLWAVVLFCVMFLTGLLWVFVDLPVNSRADVLLTMVVQTGWTLDCFRRSMNAIKARKNEDFFFFHTLWHCGAIWKIFWYYLD